MYYIVKLTVSLAGWNIGILVCCVMLWLLSLVLTVIGAIFVCLSFNRKYRQFQTISLLSCTCIWLIYVQLIVEVVLLVLVIILWIVFGVAVGILNG